MTGRHDPIGTLCKMIAIICLLLMAVFFLAGCGNDGKMSITSLPVADETVTKISGDITDASTIKEVTVHQTLQARDRAYVKAHKDSGFRVKFKMEQVSPGVYVQVMEDISFRESPRFEQPLPTAPSEHPVWRVTERLGVKALDTSTWLLAISEFFGLQRHSLDAAQQKFYGNYNPQTAAPYIVEPQVYMVPQ